MGTEIGKQIGRRLKELREARGLTQSQLAAILGKSVETISNFERGKVITSVLTLDRLARHLNVRVIDFFAADDEVTPGGVQELSKHALTVRNAAEFLSDDDLEIVAGLVEVLEARHHRKRG